MTFLCDNKKSFCLWVLSRGTVYANILEEEIITVNDKKVVPIRKKWYTVFILLLKPYHNILHPFNYKSIIMPLCLILKS